VNKQHKPEKVKGNQNVQAKKFQAVGTKKKSKGEPTNPKTKQKKP